MGKLSDQYDFVTGGGRGTGRETVLELVRHGRPTIFLYREKERKAREVVEEAAEIDPAVHVVALQCDITKAAQLTKINDTLDELGGAKLRSLFLVASGGLEPNLLADDPDYPMHINRDAQIAVLEYCWKRFLEGAKVIFDTSHWAHLKDKVVPLPGYDRIADSKNAGGRALRVRIPQLEAVVPKGVIFIEITADMLVDSIVVRGMNRLYPGMIEARQAEVGESQQLPLYRDLGQANVRALLDPNLQYGEIIVIGGGLDTLRPLGQAQ